MGGEEIDHVTLPQYPRAKNVVPTRTQLRPNINKSDQGVSPVSHSLNDDYGQNVTERNVFYNLQSDGVGEPRYQQKIPMGATAGIYCTSYGVVVAGDR